MKVTCIAFVIQNENSNRVIVIDVNNIVNHCLSFALNIYLRVL